MKCRIEKINILLSSKVTSALKMSWLRGLAPAVIYLDMKSACMNTIGLTVSSTQEISGSFFLLPWWIAAFPDFRLPYVYECKRNGKQGGQEKFPTLELDFNQVWHLVTEAVTGWIPPTWMHLKQAFFSLRFVLFFFPPVNGIEICTGQTPAEPLRLPLASVHSDYWSKLLQGCFKFVHCLFKTFKL